MKLVVLDRDGVINQDSAEFVKSPDEWLPIEGSLDAIARLTHAGYHIIVVTNQSGLSRGLFNIETLHQIHAKMYRMVHEVGGMIDAVFYASSHDNRHPDRKPNPGMLTNIEQRLNIKLKDVPIVGDSWRDIEAARQVGGQPVLVKTGNGLKTLTEIDDLESIRVFDDLVAVADHLLSHNQ